MRISKENTRQNFDKQERAGTDHHYEAANLITSVEYNTTGGPLEKDLEEEPPTSATAGDEV